MKAKVIKTGEIVDVYHEPQHGQITNIYKESVLINGRMWTEDELDFYVKTSEAPEKVYISDSELNNSEHCIIWFKSQQNEKDIEYVRKDTFIEKALTFIRSCTTYDGLGYKAKCVDIEKFKNYMKGE
jgi:hypothetical protein